MAKISALPELAAGGFAEDDEFVVVDKSATATKRAKLQSLPVERLLSTTQIDAASTSDQNLYTVPAGKKLVVTKMVLRDASVGLSDAGNMAVNAGGGNIQFFDPSNGAVTSLSLPGFLDNTISLFVFAVWRHNTFAAASVIRAVIDSGESTPATFYLDLFGYLVMA